LILEGLGERGKKKPKKWVRVLLEERVSGTPLENSVRERVLKWDCKI